MQNDRDVIIVMARMVTIPIRVFEAVTWDIPVVVPDFVQESARQVLCTTGSPMPLWMVAYSVFLKMRVVSHVCPQKKNQTWFGQNSDQFQTKIG